MLVSQRALQQEVELRWSSMVQRDAGLRGLDMLDQSVLSRKWMGGGGDLPLVDLKRENILAPESPQNVLLKAASTCDFQASTQEQVQTDNGKNSKSPKSPENAAEPEQKDAQNDVPEDKDQNDVLEHKSKVFELAEDLQRELEREAQAKEHDHAPLWIKLVRSDRFDLFIGAVIIVNTFLMLVNLELQGFEVKKEIFGECGSHDNKCDSSQPIFRKTLVSWKDKWAKWPIGTLGTFGVGP